MYHVQLMPQAEDTLTDLPDDVYSRILKALQGLESRPRPQGCVKLTGSDLWRIRVGAYRVVYAINDTDRVVTVVKIGHRRDVYR